MIKKFALKLKHRHGFSMYRTFILVILLLNITACNATQGLLTETTMDERPILAKLEIPDNSLLLFEQMSIRDPDRTSNWRFYFRQDGCFFNTRNSQLFITEASQFALDDPALFWNKAFSNIPDRCLTEQQLHELQEAMSRTDFSSLSDYYLVSSNRQQTGSFVDRWTAVIEEVSITVVAEKGAFPKQLLELQALIDRLVAEAPQP